MRIALFGVADRCVLAHSVARYLESVSYREIDEAPLRAAILADVEPPSDPVYPASYRRQAIYVLIRRALAVSREG